MCGICGIFRPDQAPIAPERVRRMADALAYRGPNMSGFTGVAGCALGHRRLSIIDLSEQGRQPMSNEDSTVTAVFNGAIYNFQELRRELQGTHDFRSRTDTEVLVHGYEEWGFRGLLARIRGMYAFAIYDQRQHALHLARDPLGKKPLFFCLTRDELVFASSAGAVNLALATSADVDPAAIYHLLRDGYIPGPATFFRQLEKLSGGQ